MQKNKNKQPTTVRATLHHPSVSVCPTNALNPLSPSSPLHAVGGAVASTQTRSVTIKRESRAKIAQNFQRITMYVEEKTQREKRGEGRGWKKEHGTKRCPSLLVPFKWIFFFLKTNPVFALTAPPQGKHL